MANTNLPKGAKQTKSSDGSKLSKITLKADYAGAEGDTAYMGGDGYPTVTRNSAYPIMGAQASSIHDKDTLAVKATAEDGDFAFFTDPTEEHEAQITTGARTDTYTTHTGASAGAFDIAGSSGAQYIDAAASVYDQCLIDGPAPHDDPAQGVYSAYGAYQKVKFHYNPTKIIKHRSNYHQAK